MNRTTRTKDLNIKTCEEYIVKQCQELEEQLLKYEEKIKDLTKDNDDLSDILKIMCNGNLYIHSLENKYVYSIEGSNEKYLNEIEIALRKYGEGKNKIFKD